jgi:threonine dehydrogenase-like Zn-dependent dehydrogenase
MNNQGRMRAVRWYGRYDIRLDEVPTPAAMDSEVLLQVESVGLCGTDVGEYVFGPLEIPLGPHPLTGASAPMTIGHEIVARVIRPARDGNGPPAGTLVMPDTQLGCGVCWWCRRHETGLCRTAAVVGLHAPGGLTEFLTSNASTLLAVPESLTADEAVFAEPLSCAVRAVRKIERQLVGSTVLVQGAGTVGVLLTQLLSACGVGRLMVIDLEPARLQLAAKLGAIQVANDDSLAAVPEPGIDVVFECTGAPGQTATALRRVRAGGTVVCIGIHNRPSPWICSPR